MNNHRRSTTRFQGKPLCIEWSRAARRALEQAHGPLLVEMELHFGCLIRKRVRFFEQDSGKRFDPVTLEVSLAFRPVMTQSCDIGEHVSPPIEDFDIQPKRAYIPKWLCIHHRNGTWEGTFGY